MWIGQPDSALSWSYSLKNDQVGAPREAAPEEGVIGRIELGRFSDSGRVVVGEEELRVWRPGLLFGPFVLEKGPRRFATGAPLSRAHSFSVEDEAGGEFVLGPDPAQTDRLGLELLQEGRRVGGLLHDGKLSRVLQLDFAPSVPVRLGLFCAWLACLLWRREPESFGGIPS